MDEDEQGDGPFRQGDSRPTETGGDPKIDHRPRKRASRNPQSPIASDPAAAPRAALRAWSGEVLHEPPRMTYSFSLVVERIPSRAREG